MTRDQLVRAFETRLTHPVSARELIQLLRVPREERVGVRRQLKALTGDGTLVLVRGHRYALPGRMDVVVGRLSLHPDGYGFVKPDTADADEPGDVYVSPFSTADAMHGDRVTVRVDERRFDRRRAGRITKILDRANAQLIGRFEADPSGRAWVVPHDRRVGQDLSIPDDGRGRARAGDMVVAEITRWPTATRGPVGQVVEVLGPLDDPGVDALVVMRKHGIPDAHGPAGLAEAARLGSEVRADDMTGRTDFRAWPTVTIDGEHARDFDDAISLEKTVDGHFRLGVHIADVSHYVVEGSALDAEALDRGTSVYFPERAVHMLPSNLAAGLCSLMPGVDRLVQSCLMDLDRDGNVVHYEFHDGIIRSAARLTYTEVNAILTDRDPETVARHAPLVPLIDLMREAFDVLLARRRKRGAIDFDLPQPEIVLDAAGLIEAIVPAERNVAHRIIEEFMLAANETVARHMHDGEHPSLYRVHDAPDPFKVEEFGAFVTSLGFGFTPHADGVRPRDFQRLIEQVRGAPEEKPVAFLMLRTMQLARYDAGNRGHFGLALDTYTHFTSPIRRYPDLVVHRELRRARQRRPVRGDVAEQTDALADIARRSSERERRAMDAERELVQWKKARFMAQKIGDEFDGVVTGVAPFGLFVELVEHFVEGLVHVATLADDDYRFAEGSLQLRGSRTGKVYQLGDRVRVQVVRVDLERRQIELGLVEVLEQVRRAGRDVRIRSRSRAKTGAAASGRGRSEKGAGQRAKSPVVRGAGRVRSRRRRRR
jgi:ribonuclease R